MIMFFDDDDYQLINCYNYMWLYVVATVSFLSENSQFKFKK